MALGSTIRLVRRTVAAVLWVLVLPAWFANLTAALALGNLLRDAQSWSPEDPLPTGTYVLVWLGSAGVVVLFAALAFRGAPPWSEWTHPRTVRIAVAVMALTLGCLVTAISPGIEAVAGPLHPVAFVAGIAAWAVLGGLAVTQGLLGNRGRAALAVAGLAGWGAPAFLIDGTALALVQVLALVLAVAAVAEYTWMLSGRHGVSLRENFRAQVRYKIRHWLWRYGLATGPQWFHSRRAGFRGEPPEPPSVHPEIDKVSEGLSRLTGDD